MPVDRRFILNLQGKDYITYEGLLDAAHKKGLTGIETELISYNGDNGQTIFKAIAKTENQSFTGYGDADFSNVNSMIQKHIIRMAETRAKARALRDLTNIGMAAIEELGGDDTDYTTNVSPAYNENTVISFGKYKGQTLVEVLEKDRGYIEYLSNKATNEEIRKICAELLGRNQLSTPLQ
ncbi:hypothetical protein QBE52_05720 [Clostridiaceae bacterium 35-E11]